MLQPFVPVLAIAVGQVIALIIFTISVLSWFVNIIQGNQPNGAPRPKNRPRDPAQSELEKFLQEVITGQQAPPERKRPAPQQKQPRTANEKKGNKSKPQQTPRPAKSEPVAEKPGQRLAQSHLQTSALGEGVRSHLSDYMQANRVGAAVQQDIDAAVRHDIGSNNSSQAAQRAGSVHPLAQALRDPQGVRQAILLNEILNKPKALR